MLLVSDSTVVHDMSYKIAYNITSWLPFVVVAIIAIAIINHRINGVVGIFWRRLVLVGVLRLFFKKVSTCLLIRLF